MQKKLNKKYIFEKDNFKLKNINFYKKIKFIKMILNYVILLQINFLF